MAPFARQFRKSRWLQLLLAVLFVGRALVPAGFMPGQGGLMLCPAYGPAQAASGLSAPMDMADAVMAGMDMSGMDMSVHMDHGGGHAGHEGMGHDGMGHDGRCDYAAAASGSTHGSVYSLPPVAYAPGAPGDVPPPAERLVPRGAIVPTRLPRGPPALS